MKLKFWLPLILFALMVIVFWQGLYKDPHIINSPLLNRALPQFSAEELSNSEQHISQEIFLGKISLLNVFATWCIACRDENNFLMNISTNQHIQLIGLDYRDNKAEALQWLKLYGNPYSQIIFDPKGRVAIELGVYGTPESFLIDKQGIIRYKQIGSLTQQAWLKVFVPLIEQLERES